MGLKSLNSSYIGIRFSAMTTDLSASSFHLKAVDEAGYPNMDFEEWYRKGMACFRVRLPRELVLQAFRHLAKEWERRNKIVAMWHIRAFVYGLSGRDDRGQRGRLVPEDFSWPIRLIAPGSGSSALILTACVTSTWFTQLVAVSGRRTMVLSIFQDLTVRGSKTWASRS